MKKANLASGLIIVSTLALVSMHYFGRNNATQVTSKASSPSLTQSKLISMTSVPFRPEKPSNSPQSMELESAQLEREISELNHEIERGGYIDRINNPETPDAIKQDLRERLRLMVKKTLALSRLNIKRLDTEASL